MISSRSWKNAYRIYFFGVQKTLDNTLSDLKKIKSTCSISADFINQFLIFEKAAENISKITAQCTGFRPVFSLASEISKKRCEILQDIRKIERFCGNFKNCPYSIKNYKNQFMMICDDYRKILKNIGNCCNVNIYFLKFMIEYNNFCVSLNQNALKYRLCPQLRLIAEYSVLTCRKENVKMKDILSLIK